MARRKGQKRQTIIYKLLHRKLNIEQPELHYKLWMNCAPEEWSVPVPLMASIMFLLLQARLYTMKGERRFLLLQARLYTMKEERRFQSGIEINKTLSLFPDKWNNTRTRRFFFFFFSIQQNFKAEDYLLVRMRDKWFEKYIHFCILHLSQWIIYKLFIYFFFSYKIFGKTQCCWIVDTYRFKCKSVTQGIWYSGKTSISFIILHSFWRVSYI